MEITPVSNLNGTVSVPGDKSISHRSIMIGALAEGTIEISGFLPGEDCLSTIRCMRQLGVEIEHSENYSNVIVKGKGWSNLIEPTFPLNVGNSGTTIRLLTGVLSAQPFLSVLYGDESIAKRPMKRIVDPLRKMGANIQGRSDGKFAPLVLNGSSLSGVEYVSNVASAQVKSAVLLAGLQSEGRTTFTEPSQSRDHTERMLKYFGVNLSVVDHSISMQGGQKLQAKPIKIPGDISSAAFLIAATIICPNSSIKILDVGVNPTRTGFIDVLQKMGARIELTNTRFWGEEPVADIVVSTSELTGIEIKGSIISNIIDELPILAVVASQANGKTIVSDAAELRVKETDRIETITNELRKFGANIEAKPDGFIVQGRTPLKGNVAESYGDHRIAMSMAIAGLIASGKTTITNAEVIDISFPNFEKVMKSLF